MRVVFYSRTTKNPVCYFRRIHFPRSFSERNEHGLYLFIIRRDAPNMPSPKNGFIEKFMRTFISIIIHIEIYPRISILFRSFRIIVFRAFFNCLFPCAFFFFFPRPELKVKSTNRARIEVQLPMLKSLFLSIKTFNNPRGFSLVTVLEIASKFDL